MYDLIYEPSLVDLDPDFHEFGDRNWQTFIGATKFLCSASEKEKLYEIKKKDFFVVIDGKIKLQNRQFRLRLVSLDHDLC